MATAKKAKAPATTQAKSTGQALSPDKTTSATPPVVRPAAAEPTKTNSIDPGPLVDELGEIQQRLAPYLRDFARAEVLKSTIRGLTDDQTTYVKGEKYVAVLGLRQNKTIVDYYGVAKRIGLDAYAQIATATVEALSKAVKPGILANYLRTESTGTRPMQVVAKEAK